MFDYLQHFNNLPKDLRDQVSSPSAMASISELEKKYQIDLAMVVMKVMIKSLTVKSLPGFLTAEFSLTPDRAANLTKEMIEKVFMPVAGYLGLDSELRALDLDKDIDVLIQQAGLTLPSANLVNRFKKILATYLKGIRSKIDTRASLAKDAKIGGLNFSQEEIDRVFKVCDKQKFKSLEIQENLPASPAKTAPIASARLNEIIGQADKAQAGEYNLKQALISGQVKPVSGSAPIIEPVKSPVHPTAKLVEPVPALKLEVPEKILDLPQPEPKDNVSEKKAVQLEHTPTGQMAAAIYNKNNVPPVSRPVPPSMTKLRPAVGSVLTGKTAVPLAKVAPVVSSPAPAPVKPSLANRPVPAPSANRPQMHDIKAVPKVMGPVEELRFLDLANFRRLGPTTTEAVSKILGKIKLLERDGYDKMVAGVQAWRQGLVNRLYVRIGQEAVAQGITLKEAVEARKKAGLEYLTMEEIEAIVSLNSKLVF